MINLAFTCTGPYAILIMLGVKRVENRNAMPVPSKGRCAVSCSKSFNAAEYGNFVQWASRALPPDDFERIPSWGDVKEWPGKIIGCADYSCRERVPQELWDEGYRHCWDLSEVVCFEDPIPCRGNVGMWQMPPDLAAKTNAADALARCEGAKITTASDAERLFRVALPIAGGREGFFVLPLDGAHKCLSAPILVSLGEPTTAVVQPGEVFSAALKVGAEAVILAHNHPSGDVTPSAQDRQLTSEITALGERLGVKVLDHLIIGS